MSILAFFPWLRLREGVRIGDFELIPYKRATQPSGPNTAEQQIIDTLLAPYRTAPKVSIKSATLLRTPNRSLLSDASEEQVSEALRFGELITFAGLAARRFFDQFGYSNRDHFRLVLQRFTDPSVGSAIMSRRRDGNGWTMVSGTAYIVLKPIHVGAEPFQSLDVPFLEALHRRSAREDWGEIEEALVGFNSANSDSPDVREESEAVALVGAFERVFGLNAGREDDLAKAFVAALVTESIAPLSCERIRSADSRGRFEKYASLREAWIRDFYRLRGDHSHGKIAPSYSSLWSLPEHLLLASFIMPLVVKSRLVRDGDYAWTTSDRAKTQVLEQLLCERHFVGNEAGKDAGQSWMNLLDAAETQFRLEKWIMERDE